MAALAFAGAGDAVLRRLVEAPDAARVAGVFARRPACAAATAGRGA